MNKGSWFWEVSTILVGVILAELIIMLGQKCGIIPKPSEL